LTAGTSYYYRLRAVNTGGSSAPATTKATTEPYGTGLLATYADKEGNRVSRLDTAIHFNWGEGSPAPGIGTDHFTVRWEGQIEADYSETHTFYTATDDGVRLWVDGRLLIDHWEKDHKGTGHSAAIALQAGVKYAIVMEYFEHGAFARASLAWESKSLSRRVVPQKNLYPTTQSVVSAAAPTLPETGSAEWQNLNVALFPNPAAHFVNVEFAAPHRAEVQVTLANKMGEPMLTWSKEATAGANQFNLPVYSLKHGIYLLTIQTGGTRLVKLLVIDK